MKTEEVIEVLQAYKDGKEIQFQDTEWRDVKNLPELLFMYGNGVSVRVKPEPKIEKVERYTSFDMEGVIRLPTVGKFEIDTHCITYNLVDGEPDLESFKIEKL